MSSFGIWHKAILCSIALLFVGAAIVKWQGTENGQHWAAIESASPRDDDLNVDANEAELVAPIAAAPIPSAAANPPGKPSMPKALPPKSLTVEEGSPAVEQPKTEDDFVPSIADTGYPPFEPQPKTSNFNGELKTTDHPRSVGQANKIDFLPDATNRNTAEATTQQVSHSDFIPDSGDTKRPVALAGSGDFNPEIQPAENQVAQSTSFQRKLPAQKVTEKQQSHSPIVEQRALSHVGYGQTLARRGAMFAARHEFLEALRLVAESTDYQTGTRQRTQSLASAMLALEEADDFQVADNQTQLTLDVASVVQTHNSRILNSESTRQMSPISAMQAYYVFANNQLKRCFNDSRAASAALHELGMLHKTLADFGGQGKPVDRAKAMVMFEASLSADPGNASSSLELARLLVTNGHLRDARQLYIDCLRQSETPEAWNELAEVHRILGETELSQLALREANKMPGEVVKDGETNVRLVTAAEFNNSSWPTAPIQTPPLQKGQKIESTASKSNKLNNWIKPIKDWF